MKFSNSKIQCFKNCRRMYELKYIYGLEAVEKADTLKDGSDYHECVEKELKGEEWHSDNPKIVAMVNAFIKYIKPNLPEIAETETWFEYESGNDEIIGRLDAKTVDGFAVEHKTTSYDLGGEYLLQLENDEQVKTYMLGTGKNKVIYTVCKKPTIRIKQNETDEQYIERCSEWYAEDVERRCGIVEVIRLNEDLERFREEQDEMVREINRAKSFYKVPSFCFRYNRQCDYASICNNYDPELNYIEFRKKEEVNYNEVNGND